MVDVRRELVRGRRNDVLLPATGGAQLQLDVRGHRVIGGQARAPVHSALHVDAGQNKKKDRKVFVS